MMPSAHEDHCWLHFGGRDVRIVAMRGLAAIDVVDRYGARARLDLSAVNWPGYIAKARAYMGWQWPMAGE